MKTFVLAAAFAALSAVAAQATTLTATVRDFDSTHPNFGQGSPFTGALTGIVDTTLSGSAPTPVFTEGGRTDNPVNFTSHADFNSWWTGTPAGFVGTSTYDMQFSESGGFLTFDGAAQTPGSQFYPIGNGNHLFTLAVSGLLSFLSGDTFSVTSDDDVWVFVNKTLVLEMAGVHAPTSASFSAATLAGLGLIEGTNYALDIFFAERNVTQSELTIRTNMSIAPIPLPATALLLMAGLAGLGAASRRRRS